MQVNAMEEYVAGLSSGYVDIFILAPNRAVAEEICRSIYKKPYSLSSVDKKQDKYLSDIYLPYFKKKKILQGYVTISNPKVKAYKTRQDIITDILNVI